MKKSKKLVLNRETLHRLSEPELRLGVGGETNRDCLPDTVYCVTGQVSGCPSDCYSC